MKAPIRIPGPLGNYVIFTKLNKGGMADVYLGQPIYAPDRWVAVKTLLPKLTRSKKFVSMFHSEGTLGRMFDHPNIVRTWDVGRLELEGGTVHFLAMDYVHGRDLGAVARYFREERTRMPIGQALYAAQEVLSGLAYAHDLTDDSGKLLHLVNRDVSPANIMIGFDGQVRLIDFGIAQATMDFRSQIGSIRGKLSYMSPEQVRGLPVDARSDLFSLSVVIYQLLTGVEPFVGEGEFEQMEKIRAAEPAPPSTLNHLVAPDLEALVMKGLAKNPAERFADAGEMLAAVVAVRERMGSDYGKEALKDFMQSAFKGDIALLLARVNKARRLLRESSPGLAQDADLSEGEEVFEISVDLSTEGSLNKGPHSGDPTVVMGASEEPFDMLERAPAPPPEPEAPPPVEEAPPAPAPEPPPEPEALPEPPPSISVHRPAQPSGGMPRWVPWLLALLILIILGLAGILLLKLAT